MIDFKFNKKKAIPDLRRYAKILIGAYLVWVLFLEYVLFNIFPILEDLQYPWDFIVLTIIVVYLTDLIDVKFGGTDWF